MKDVCPFCERPDPVLDQTTLEVGRNSVRADCFRCTHCSRLYFTVEQVHTIVASVCEVNNWEKSVSGNLRP